MYDVLGHGRKSLIRVKILTKTKWDLGIREDKKKGGDEGKKKRNG
jgi:hypothetical protein